MLISFIIFLFYGLAFFILGFAILLKDKRFSRLEIAHLLKYLAFFAILHGIHEWIDLYLLMEKNCINLTQLDLWYHIKFAILLASFIFLLFFGLKAISNIAQLNVKISGNIVFSVLVITLAAPVYFYSIKYTNDFLIRYIFGFSSAILTGISFLILSAKYKKLHIYGYNNLLVCGFMFIGYGIASGLITSNFIFDIKYVVAIRGILAILIFIFLFRFLKVFDNEYITMVEENLKSSALNDRLSSIGKLATGIAHEINNPLTNATMIIEILKDKLTDNKKVYDKVLSLEKNIDRAAKIAKELLLFSKNEKIQTFERITISTLIDNVKLFIRNHEKFKYLKFDIQEECELECIPHKIEEMVINLILNSFDAIENNPLIILTVYCDKKFVYIIVQDNGKGIDESIKGKIFDPFYTTKKPTKGTGMGLYLCYNIAKIHNGSITLENSEDNLTTFLIKLPRFQN